jgi:hypothetical protein
MMSLQVFNQFTNGALANRLDICCRSPNFPKSCKFKIWGLRGIECGPICLSRHSHFQRAQVPEHVAERGLRFFNKSKEERFWNALAWEAFRSIQEAKWCECERLWMFFLKATWCTSMCIDVLGKSWSSASWLWQVQGQALSKAWYVRWQEIKSGMESAPWWRLAMADNYGSQALLHIGMAWNGWNDTVMTQSWHIWISVSLIIIIYINIL